MESPKHIVLQVLVEWALVPGRPYITFQIQEPQKGNVRPMSLPKVVVHGNADKFPEYFHWASFLVQNTHFIWEHFFLVKISQ